MSLMTLAEAKQWLRISHSTEDTVLQTVLDALESWIAKKLGIVFYTGSSNEIIEYLDGGVRNLYPVNKPINSITEVYDVVAGAIVSTDYYDFTEDRIIYHQEEKWPSRDSKTRRYRVTFQGGYNATSLPAEIKLLILAFFRRWYLQRSGQKSEKEAGHSIVWGNYLSSDLHIAMQACTHSLPFG